MADITAGMVKELRERSGAGMSDCKTALVETKGDINAAIDWLRKKGIVKAEKKSDRIAAQGLIGVTAGANTGAMVEVNSETDFVARNDQFQDLVAKITSLAPAADGDIAKLQAAKMPGTAQTVEATVKDAIATIGENMNVRRTAALTVQSGVVGGYMHSAVKPNLGKIGVLVGLEFRGQEFGRARSPGQGHRHARCSVQPALARPCFPAEGVSRSRACDHGREECRQEA